MYLLISLVIIIVVTAYWIYKSTKSPVFTLAICNLIGLYYLSIASVVINRFNKKIIYPEEQIIKGPLWLRLAGIIVISSNSGYIGYLLSGGKFSIFTLLSFLFVSFLIYGFLGWLQYGRKKTNVDLIKQKIANTIIELNSRQEPD